MTITPRTAVVTAAGGGIGAAITRRLLAQQYTVFAADNDPDALERLRQSARSSRLQPVVCDVTDPVAVERAFAEIGRHGPLHVLINGVGSTCSGGIRDLSLERWHAMFGLNLTSVFLATRAALPLLEAATGDRVVITLSSTLAAVADHTTIAYSTFKAGLEQFTRALALELAPSKIRAVAVAPGPVTATGGEASFDTESNARLNPLGRFATPDEVAALTAFLVSEEATYLTGAIIRLDGGDAALGAGWRPLEALIRRHSSDMHGAGIA